MLLNIVTFSRRLNVGISGLHVTTLRRDGAANFTAGRRDVFLTILTLLQFTTVRRTYATTGRRARTPRRAAVKPPIFTAVLS